MSKFGTCKHAFQIQEMYEFGHHPHEKDNRVDSSDSYTCQWLDTAGELPPPVQRRHGGFDIRPTDCDNCKRYEEAAPRIAWMKTNVSKEEMIDFLAGRRQGQGDKG